ncbi:hypothetical protein ACFC0S_00400 [Streptomyces sp. NPDC056084]|uniref:hypothetical protein n=1 Tax=unclassified Streptomyces TaxID=2593676 RepID=UPI0035D7024F
MTTVAEITALLRPLPSPNPYPSVMVDDKQDASRALTAALQYFDADDERQAVTVHLAGEELGLLHRHDAYSLPPPRLSTRDYGASDQAALLGDVRYEMINMRCPVTNCSHRFALILYPLRPPQCPAHPEQTLVVAG